MNSEQIQLVQSSFAKVRPIATVAAELFYGRLFELDPSLRPLFKGDIVAQGRMLMSMLNAAVAGLQDLDALTPVVRQLGARHVRYGVQDQHYATVGEALLWTLEKGLAADFTPAVRDAWIAAYALLAGEMQRGAAEVPVPAEPAAQRSVPSSTLPLEAGPSGWRTHLGMATRAHGLALLAAGGIALAALAGAIAAFSMPQPAMADAPVYPPVQATTPVKAGDFIDHSVVNRQNLPLESDASLLHSDPNAYNASVANR